jgi:hypothetical protein
MASATIATTARVDTVLILFLAIMVFSFWTTQDEIKQERQTFGSVSFSYEGNVSRAKLFPNNVAITSFAIVQAKPPTFSRPCQLERLPTMLPAATRNGTPSGRLCQEQNHRPKARMTNARESTAQPS